MAIPILSSIAGFLGITSLRATGRDAYIIITLRSLRMFTSGIPSLILALFFASLKFPDSRIGVFMTLTLLGDVLLSLLLTLVADKLGRRRILFGGSIMMAFSGVVFALSENFWTLLIAAVFGIISVTGADCGPFRAVEESILSGLTDEKTRSDVLAWYVTFTTMAGAVGAEVAGRVVHALEKRHDVVKAYHALFWAYAAFGVVGSVLCLGLSERCEAAGERHAELQKRRRNDGEEEEVLLEAMAPSSADGSDHEEIRPARHADIRVSPKKKQSYFSQISKTTRSIMYKLWILLAIDSLADGMTPYSLINYYVEQKFHVSKATLGDITSASQFLCAVSAVFAGPLAKKIGLINTMVFTHLPSSIASAFVPLPKTIGPTIGILLFRAALNSMDQAPRTAFIAAVVKPEERTGAMGITSMVRTLAMSVGPSITGLLSGSNAFWVAFLATGTCRITYDIGLWVLFSTVKLDNKPVAREDDLNSVDDEAWNGLLSDSDDDSDLSSDGRKSKDLERAQNRA
ncbi:major facilitator superfamily domain-containing protein [Boeremia exigua]|uniref:major facilitator superfamily domain-containing protein n=1 Tax=Boeremia exigua TaxID=749465 RepID=UPI001E8DAD8F|nr:major facilitator superfamily domain-containing protein [Boeremia exigua]KAH6638254.1 major facilitator superfamily domain-containing protein [Boeremia exigua]